MKILFVIDGRSPIALNWINYFLEKEHDIHIVSTYPCEPIVGAATLRIIPTAFSTAVSYQDRKISKSKKQKHLLRIGSASLRTAIRQRIAPFTLKSAAEHLKKELKRINPDLVHAMRIPYEGMVSAIAGPECPLMISIWGNDFTLHARSTKHLAQLTKNTILKCDALHTDCYRDAHLAREWGFSLNKPAIVMPGNGGVRREWFYPSEEKGDGESNTTSRNVDSSIINPRGIRAYIRNDVFFKSIPFVLKGYPGCKFICPDMEGYTEVNKWIEQLGISKNVKLLGKQSPAQMASLYRVSRVMVSVSEHDGTPNTLLEAMACGCLPVVGDIESLREWIQDGINGLLINPADPEALGNAIKFALQNENFYKSALQINQRIIKERADYEVNMQSAHEFYLNLIRD